MIAGFPLPPTVHSAGPPSSLQTALARPCLQGLLDVLLLAELLLTAVFKVSFDSQHPGIEAVVQQYTAADEEEELMGRVRREPRQGRLHARRRRRHQCSHLLARSCSPEICSYVVDACWRTCSDPFIGVHALHASSTIFAIRPLSILLLKSITSRARDLIILYLILHSRTVSYCVAYVGACCNCSHKRRCRAQNDYSSAGISN